MRRDLGPGLWTRTRGGMADAVVAGMGLILGAALVRVWHGAEGNRPAGTSGQAPYAETARGRFAQGPGDLPVTGWRDVFMRIYGNLSSHRILAVAAGVTFYVMLALFPALASFVSLFGLYAEPRTVIAELQQWQGVLPAAAVDIIAGQIERIAAGTGRSLGLAFAASLAVALWSANAGMKALFDALNVVYGEEEKRGFLKLNAVSLLFTCGALVLMLLAMSAVVLVPVLLSVVPALPGELVIRWGRWPLLFLVISGGLALIYRYAPSRERPRWQWLSVGSGFAAIGWLAGSMLFSWYAANMADYNETYGSLGAIIAFMVWIWLSVTVVLLGAEINAEAEHQTLVDSTTGPARPLGQRGAVMADSVGAPSM